MVRILIGLRRAIARHQLTGASTVALAVTGALVLVTAIATLLTGWLSYAREATATDVLALVSLLWIGGRIAQSALSGEPFLRPEMFSLLPLPRRRLGWSLMLIGLLDPVNALAAIALGAVLVHGIRLGPAAAVTAAFAVVLTVAAGSVLSTLAAGMLGPGSCRGRDTLDAAGNPTPAWSLKVHVALVAVALTALPTALVLVAGGGWLAVPAGVLTGTVLAAWLGRLAATRLNEHQVGILHMPATAA